jgi:uncharacterized lipoprotein YbaY
MIIFNNNIWNLRLIILFITFLLSTNFVNFLSFATEESKKSNDWISGKIVFDNLTASLYRSTIIIYLEDISLQDAPSKLIRYKTMNNITYEHNKDKGIDFSINGSVPDIERIYNIRIDIDVNNNGIIDKGDYISTKLYSLSPKLNIGYNNLIINMEKID